MSLGELKPILTTLLLPPAGPVLALALGAALIWSAGSSALRRRLGACLAVVAALALWLLSCNAVAVWLARTALPQVPVLEPAQASALRAQGVQAVVVLGGGVLPEAPEYGQAQPCASTAARLRYGLKLARQAGLPLGFSGGVGWAAAGQGPWPSEAQAALAMARETGQEIRWLDGQSRDTFENAQAMRALLQPAGVYKIALVTQAWHMPRSVANFERAGFEVRPAPMGLVLPRSRPVLEWLPSPHGLQASTWVLREWLALRLM
jgi:uncharacterized SAM-binding protein YcdF (DUF218 family)